MRKINTLVIHHSGNTDSFEEIKHLHVNINGWTDIGYHYVISRYGKLIEGRKQDIIGAHVKGFNNDSIGICLLGNFDKEKPREKQLEALANLIKNLMNAFLLEKKDIKFHRDFPNANKTCPGNNLKKEMVLKLL